MKLISSIFLEYFIALLWQGIKKDKQDLIRIKELKNISIFQIAKFKSSNIDTNSIKIDGLNFPQAYPTVNHNNETRILWTGPDICIVVSSDKNIKDKIAQAVNEEDFATTDLSHSRAGIEISGKHSIDVLKKGTPFFNLIPELLTTLISKQTKSAMERWVEISCNESALASTSPLLRNSKYSPFAWEAPLFMAS